MKLANGDHNCRRHFPLAVAASCGAMDAPTMTTRQQKGSALGSQPSLCTVSSHQSDSKWQLQQQTPVRACDTKGPSRLAQLRAGTRAQQTSQVDDRPAHQQQQQQPRARRRHQATNGASHSMACKVADSVANRLAPNDATCSLGAGSCAESSGGCQSCCCYYYECAIGEQATIVTTNSTANRTTTTTSGSISTSECDTLSGKSQSRIKMMGENLLAAKMRRIRSKISSSSAGKSQVLLATAKTANQNNCCCPPTNQTSGCLPANSDDCVKCQLIARWTSAQAKLINLSSRKSRQAQRSSEQLAQQQQQLQDNQLASQQHQQVTFKCSARSQSELMNRKRRVSDQRVDGDQSAAEMRGNLQAASEDYQDEDDISSLTISSCEEDNGLNETINLQRRDKWSISSCYESASPPPLTGGCGVNDLDEREDDIRASKRHDNDTTTTATTYAQNKPTNLLMLKRRPDRSRVHVVMGVPPPPPPPPMPPQRGSQWSSLRRRRPVIASAGLTVAIPAATPTRVAAHRKRRQAPPPPSAVQSANRFSLQSAPMTPTSSSSSTDQQPPVRITQLTTNGSSSPDSDSGAGTGNHSSSSAASSVSSTSASHHHQVVKEDSNNPPKLLTESEAFSIECALKSHKSSIYVCGCMANLYLTKTQLVDNGRTSRPGAEGWQLSRTGVPVLTFNSGLTRNRSRRQLSISLTERGSGFVLWSDVIDHLSNYRAFSNSVLGASDASTSGQSMSNVQQRLAAELTTTCDSFHVMYLSSNHRIMVGLSFDDATCARLFLKQVELVTSDPANISLTGPKLAHRLGATRSRLGRLLRGGSSDGKRRQNIVKSSKLKLSSPSEGLQLQNNTKFTSSSDSNSSSSWSTLKRAMRFGQPSRHSVALSLDQSVDLSSEHQHVAAIFMPKPLASLASAGKTYNKRSAAKESSLLGKAKSKRMPRKCDISAPCLFQHVTRVDINGLDQLYSKSLITPTSGTPVTPPTTTTTSTTATTIANTTATSQLRTQHGQANAINQRDCNEDNDDDHDDHLGGGASGRLTEVGRPTGARQTIELGANRLAGCSGNGSSSDKDQDEQQRQREFRKVIKSTGSDESPVMIRDDYRANHQRGAASRQQNRPMVSGVELRKNHPADHPSGRAAATAAAATTISTGSSSSCCSSSIASESSRGDGHAPAPVYAKPVRNLPRTPMRRPETNRPGHLHAHLVGRDSLPPPPPAPPTAQAANNKIQAIIRDLESQTSVELVDAKRKLMADIADQVMARQSARAAAALTSSFGGGGNGQPTSGYRRNPTSSRGELGGQASVSRL